METTIQTIWSKTRVLVKALIIGFLVLLLQIPTFFVKELIIEREQRQKDAITEVSSRWAGKQNIAGPMLVLPYMQGISDSLTNTSVKRYAYFLPDELKINASISPEEKHRGIYKVMLYSSAINMNATYSGLDLDKLAIDPSRVLWNEAYVQLKIADQKGLNDDARVSLNGKPLATTTAVNKDEDMVFAAGLNGPGDAGQMQFKIDLDLNGSDQLHFTPVGKNTVVNLDAKWPHPSFTGDILPSTADIKTDSFSAQWRSVAQKRNFPQQWKEGAYNFEMHSPPAPGSPGQNQSLLSISSNNITAASFGADLFVPVNGYQKTMRTIKYSALCILLTFAAFFIIETTNNRSVHPFQYGLIGLALVLFYTLLLSFSEYAGFNISYVIASVCTIGLIAWFVRGIMGSSKLTTILSLVLMLMYTYVFTILQLQDYSLILGSIGLFITLAVIMHFSKKIQW